MEGVDHIIIAIGGNLDYNKERKSVTCLKAVSVLRATHGIRVLTVSHWYESAPIPSSEQPCYVNGVLLCVVRHDLFTPFTLLDFLHRVEKNYGRVRSVPNAPRTLDLDLISYGNLCFETQRLVLPHPRVHKRAFVLLPLSDIYPDWVHPKFGYNMLQMLETVQGQKIRRFET